jgi:ABC-type polar amino acid transport system ATPase subunit
MSRRLNIANLDSPDPGPFVSPILEMRGIKKSFAGVEILKGIDLTVNPQELVFIVGPSGSGKSTLLRCINRLEDPDSGLIVVDGANILDAKTNLNQVRRTIGMVFQSFNLYPHMTAVGNVELALRLVLKHDKLTANAIALSALNEVGLMHKAKAYPSELSGGQQQRVAIARAIALEPKLMLFDEPTSALDPSLVDSVLNVLRDLRGLGMTMVVVSHEMRFAKEAADRVILMRDGVIEEQGTAEHMFSSRARPETQAFVSRSVTE